MTRLNFDRWKTYLPAFLLFDEVCQLIGKKIEQLIAGASIGLLGDGNLSHHLLCLQVHRMPATSGEGGKWASNNNTGMAVAVPQKFHGPVHLYSSTTLTKWHCQKHQKTKVICRNQ
jgi:hypothetical protein